jgi:hypothetical protein
MGLASAYYAEISIRAANKAALKVRNEWNEESGRRRSRFRSEADQDSGGKPITYSGAKPISDSRLKAISNRPRAEW